MKVSLMEEWEHRVRAITSTRHVLAEKHRLFEATGEPLFEMSAYQTNLIGISEKVHVLPDMLREVLVKVLNDQADTILLAALEELSLLHRAERDALVEEAQALIKNISKK